MWLYLLRCRDNSLYTGIAVNPQQRLATHSSGKGSRYVATRLPATIVYLEGPFPDRGSALKREHAVKQLSRGQKERLLQSSEPIDALLQKFAAARS